MKGARPGAETLASDLIPVDKASVNAVEALIVSRDVDPGEMEVRRALPLTKRQMVGPFIFFDQMGPAEFLADPRSSQNVVRRDRHRRQVCLSHGRAQMDLDHRCKGRDRKTVGQHPKRLFQLFA